MIAMNHTVTIRTDTDEICFGINDDLFITRTQWPDMMNFDKATTYFAIFFLEIKTTNHTHSTVNSNGIRTILGITFIFCRIIANLATFGITSHNN